MKKNIKYILGILLSSVLVVTGCGSSSSNNPVGNGTVSSGLVSVNGNVKNSNGNGTVSFYTPTAIYGTNLDANNLRTSIANNEVYTFNIDENGNYAGQIPAGEYYVIAQNSDGSMKYASARQSFVSSARAEVTNEQTVDIVLVPTTNIEGIFCGIGDLPIKDQYVYLENMPFVTTTDEEGNFKLEGVPATSSYKICCNVWSDANKFRYFFFANASLSEITDEISLYQYEPISLSGKNVKIKFKDSNLSSEMNIIAITENNGIYSAIQIEKGSDVYYVLPIDKNTDVNMLIIKTSGSTDDTTVINRKGFDSETDGFIEITGFGKS